MENTLPQNSQPQFDSKIPVSASNNSNTLKLAIAGLLVLIPVVGVSGYYFGKQSVKTEIAAVVSPEESSVEVTSPSNAPEPIIKNEDLPQTVLNWKSIQTNISTQSEMAGRKDYTLSFEYPSNWNVKTSPGAHASDTLNKGCEDYLILSNSTNVDIKLTCSSWSGKPIQIPKDFTLVSKLNRVADDGSNIYIVRYFDAQANIHHYAEVPSSENTLTPPQEGTPELLIRTEAEKVHPYFIPLTIQVGTLDESELKTVDQIVKTFTLKQK